MIVIEPLGIVRSCFKEKFGTPRQGQLSTHSHGYIEINSQWDPYKCMQGLEEFSHIWVVFWFHDNKNRKYRPLVSPPRLPAKRIGTLASRSPMRPNPVGLSLVKIEKIAPPRLYISGLDMIDGTPVLDIKPYIEKYDRVENSKNGWLNQIEDTRLPVIFSEKSLRQLEVLERHELKQVISDILSQDIRNRNDKRIKNQSKALGFYYEDVNIVFCINSRNEVEVLDIESVSFSISK